MILESAEAFESLKTVHFFKQGSLHSKLFKKRKRAPGISYYEVVSKRFAFVELKTPGKVICTIGMLLVKSRVSSVIAHHKDGCSLGHILSVTFLMKPFGLTRLLNVVTREIRQRAAHTLNSLWGRSFNEQWPQLLCTSSVHISGTLSQPWSELKMGWGTSQNQGLSWRI